MQSITPTSIHPLRPPPPPLLLLLSDDGDAVIVRVQSDGCRVAVCIQRAIMLATSPAAAAAGDARHYARPTMLSRRVNLTK